MAQDYQPSSSRQPRRREETQRSSNTRRRKKRSGLSGAAIYAIFVIGVSALLACIGWVAANDVLALNKPEKTATITITNDDSFGDVAEKLKDEGLIEYKFLFNLFATFTRSKDDVVAGTFTLNTDMDYRALLSGMSANSATRATVTVTIPEGYTVDQIFTLLEEKGVASMEDLQDMAANHDYAFSFLQDLELGDYHRLEGYLYPDTYEFTTPQNPLYVINKMLVRFDEQFTDAMRQEVADSGRTIHEIITIASMIEKETDGNDRADIASVIYNRLNNPSGGTQGYLQIDATLAYINGGKVPTEADKSIDSPYNTYLYKGLPAGPISNPGLESIKAAMNPNSTSYYYYALGDDGVHHFFKTLREQQNFIATQELYNK
jgi:UPF0755 protein